MEFEGTTIIREVWVSIKTKGQQGQNNNGFHFSAGMLTLSREFKAFNSMINTYDCLL